MHASYSEGRLPSARTSGGRPQGNYDVKVLNEVENDPSTSVRAIEIATGVAKSTAHRFLKRYDFHPYHGQRVQSLFTRDHAPRVDFCRTMLAKIREDPDFLNKVLCTDESTFKRDGYLNLHNLHGWHTENPHLMREDRSQYQFKVNMWTGILNGQITGPFELTENLDGATYLHFLQNDLPTLLDVPLNIYREMWYQQDGCPAHYARPVREYLNELYPGK